MVELLKSIINNNFVMVYCVLIFAVFATLFAFEKVRKALFGSFVTFIISFSLTFIARFQMISDILTTLFRWIMSFLGGKGEIQSLIGFERNFIVSLATVEYECKIDIIDTFNVINEFGLCLLSFRDLIQDLKIKFETKLYSLEHRLVNKVNLSKYSYIIRI